jgi:hypothetical protein
MIPPFLKRVRLRERCPLKGQILPLPEVFVPNKIGGRGADAHHICTLIAVQVGRRATRPGHSPFFAKNAARPGFAIR